MSRAQGRIDPPTCREDLIRKAAGSTFKSAFDWINDNEAERVTNSGENRGLTAEEIRERAKDWICGGGEITCTQEKREGYRERRHFHYGITIPKSPYFPDDFPYGLYVEMELANTDENEPEVNLLNAHPQRRI